MCIRDRAYSEKREIDLIIRLSNRRAFFIPSRWGGR
jgi:hypothetical protein